MQRSRSARAAARWACTVLLALTSNAWAAGAPLADLLLREGFEHPADAALRPYSDEFTNSATLGDWRRVWRDEFWSADPLEGFDIAGTRAGWMTLLPHTSSWYEDYRGELA